MKFISLEFANSTYGSNGYLREVGIPIVFYNESETVNNKTDLEIVEQFIREDKELNDLFSKVESSIEEIKRLLSLRKKIESEFNLYVVKNKLKDLKEASTSIKKSLKVFSGNSQMDLEDCKTVLENKLTELNKEIKIQEEIIEDMKEKRKKRYKEVENIVKQIDEINYSLQKDNFYSKTVILYGLSANEIKYDSKELTKEDKFKYVFRHRVESFVKFLFKNGWKTIDSRNSINKGYLDLDETYEEFIEEQSFVNKIL